MSLLKPAAAGIVAALGGAVLLFLSLGLVILGDNSNGHEWHSNSILLQKAAARRAAADDRHDPGDGTHTVAIFGDGDRYDRHDGKQRESGEPKQWKRWREQEKAAKQKKAQAMEEVAIFQLAVMAVNIFIPIMFAVLYKIWVVDKIPPLEQRPVSADQDFQQDICACVTSGQGSLCLHAVCCCQCRAAHTWHVAGLCEYWPALFLLCCVGNGAKFVCFDVCIYTYFRMKLKDKLGIQRNLCMDVVYSIFCPWCAVAQEAMAVDMELGTQVDCCCKLQSPPAIGGVDHFERGMVTQLVNPQLDDNCNNEAQDKLSDATPAE